MVTSGIVAFFTAQPAMLEQVPQLGHIPKVFKAMSSRNDSIPKTALQIVQQLTNSEVCMRSCLSTCLCSCMFISEVCMTVCLFTCVSSFVSNIFLSVYLSVFLCLQYFDWVTESHLSCKKHCHVKCGSSLFMSGLNCRKNEPHKQNGMYCMQYCFCDVVCI